MQLPPLIKATLIKRYKRFLADVILANDNKITVYCPNTGAMTGCAESGDSVWLSHSDNPQRKYPYTWELVQTAAGEMVCIHSAKANDLAREAIEQGVIKELQGYDSIRSEVKYGDEKSRIDFMLAQGQQHCFVEVKSVTLSMPGGLGVFPDAVSERGRKHLRELISVVRDGHRAVLLFCVLHSGIDVVAPADSIDPAYAKTFRQALAAGVEVLAYRAEFTPQAMCLNQPLVVLPRQPCQVELSIAIKPLLAT